MQRGANLFITAAWQALVLCAIYATQYSMPGNGIIIWAAVVAWVASIPFPYILGGCFLQRIYETELEVYNTTLEMHH
jgi:hypothetical protein